MSANSNKRVVSASQTDALIAIYAGGCPVCARPAVWAFTGRESPDRVLLEPASGARLSVPPGRTVVVASAAGRLEVAEARTYRLHVCDPDVMTSQIGQYTAVILAHPCPVESCSAPPSELCVSPRYEVLPRPHGARVAVATGQPWTDEDQFGSTVLDEEE